MPHLPLVDPDRRLVVFWTPRCGSTTLLTWFFHAIGLGDELRSRSAHTLRVAWQREHGPDAAELAELYRRPDVRTVVVCRDPIERAVSSYYLALTSTSSQWNAIREARPELDETRRLSFDGFLDYLESVDLETCDLHWRLQSAQDWHRLGLDVDRFVRTESLAEDLEALGRDTGLAGPVRHASVTPRSDVEASAGPPASPRPTAAWPRSG